MFPSDRAHFGSRDDRPEGVYLDVSNVRKVFLRMLDKAELRHRRIHDLRHTFASLLIQQGEPLAYVQKQMGHSSIMITADVYGKWEPGGNREAVDRLDHSSVQPARRQVHEQGRLERLA